MIDIKLSAPKRAAEPIATQPCSCWLIASSDYNDDGDISSRSSNDDGDCDYNNDNTDQYDDDDDIDYNHDTDQYDNNTSQLIDQIVIIVRCNSVEQSASYNYYSSSCDVSWFFSTILF